MDNVVIRKAQKKDSDTIVDLGKKTFVETYSEIGFDETLEQHVGEKFAPQRIQEELANPMASFYLAYVNDVPVAFTKLRSDRKPRGIENKKTLEIERIYVLREFQGLKVGWEMMEHCKQLAKQQQYDVIWLQVWQQNHRAIQFYQKAGFVVFETAVFNYSAGHMQHDFLMRLNLYY